jgi:putative flippase GtrA
VRTIIAWAAAVIFAYLTNKPFVFGSHDWSLKVVAPEFGKFLGSRVASGVLVTLAITLTVDILGWNFTLMKIVTSIANIILNYIASKLLVFKK